LKYNIIIKSLNTTYKLINNMSSENNDNTINISCSEDNDPSESTQEYNINLDIANFLQEFEKMSKKKTNNNVMDHSELYAEISNYDMNFSVKQLTLICEYYGIRNQIKGKVKKTDIIEHIMMYENNPDNILTVLKRKQLWYYIDEIKADKFLRKHIINW